MGEGGERTRPIPSDEHAARTGGGNQVAAGEAGIFSGRECTQNHDMRKVEKVVEQGDRRRKERARKGKKKIEETKKVMIRHERKWGNGTNKIERSKELNLSCRLV